jgi:hypothetical protein
MSYPVAHGSETPELEWASLAREVMPRIEWWAEGGKAGDPPLAYFFTSPYFDGLPASWKWGGMDPGDEKRGGEVEPPLVAMARFSGYGLTLAMATAGFLFLGWWVDGKLGTAPWLTLLGALVGATGGFYHILQHLIFFPREEARRKSAASGEAAQDEKGPK